MALGMFLASVALGAGWGSSSMAAPAVLLNEPFTGTSISNPTNWVAAASLNGSATSTFPCLTATTNSSSQSLASGVLRGCEASAIDASGSGALRLTPALNSASGYILYDQALSTRDGLDITFKQAQYGGTVTGVKADGLSFFLKNGSNTNLAAGSSGDGLGYSLSCTLKGSNNLAVPGVPGGLFGIGFDVYGNYSIGSASGGNWAGNPNCGGSNRPSYLGIKGPDTSTGQDGTQGFEWLSGSGGAGTGASIDLISGADTRSGRARNVRVVVDPATAANPKIKVYFWAINGSAPGTATLEVAQPARYTAASTFKFGFTASTGGANNIHEIFDLVIRGAQDPTYRVTYDANGSTGGSVPVDSTAYSGTGSVSVAGNTGSLVKTGFLFGGWNTAANGTGVSYAAGSTLTLANADVTLYAVWSSPPAPPPPPPTPPTITLTFDPQGGACGTGTVSGFASSWVPLANDCRRSGWTLAGWAHQGGVQTANFAADQQVQLTESTTLYAVWKRVVVPTPDAPAATPPTPPDGVTAPPTETGEVLDVPALPASIVVISVPAATPVDQLATSCREAGLRFAVGFRSLDATLKRAARAWIRANAPNAGCRYVVKGYVQPVGATGNDTSLSAARARAVASAINAAPGSMTVNANRRQTAAACARFENRCVIVGVFGN